MSKRQKQGPRPSAGREPGEITFGLRAGLAVIARRPGDVQAVAHAGDPTPELAEALAAMEQRGVRCTAMSERDLEIRAGSNHHEGLAVTARPRQWLPAKQLAELLLARNGVAVALDRVRNPYNIGAILRSAAFFGVDAVVLGALATGPELAPNAVRVAEGGAERLVLCRTSDVGGTLASLRSRGIRVVGSDGSSRQSAFGFRYERPMVLVMGHEREGMTERVRAVCDAVVAIPGSGAVESLNVAVATGVLIAEAMRERR